MGAAPILTILKDGEMIKSVPLNGDSVLGRAEGCVIRLEDRAISRQHAVFKPGSKGVQVEKQSEFAPLLVNGAEATSALVKEGDVINIGPYLLRVSMPKEATSPAGPLEQAPEAPIGDAPIAPVRPEAAIEMPGPQDGMLDVGSAPPMQTGGPSSGGVLESGEPESLGDLALPPVDAQSSPEIESASVGGEVLAPDADGMGPNQSPPQGLQADPIDEAADDARTKLTPVAKISVKLLFAEGAANVREFEMTKDEVSIGRGKNCDIVLNDKKSSRKNCIIRRAGLNFIIKDLDSANGTFVNGHKITEQELSGDDIIKIGSTEFVFKALSADYSSKEKDFLSLPLEEEIPAEGMQDLGGDPLPALAEDAAAVPAVDPNAAMGLDLGATPDVAGAPAIPGITGIGGAAGTASKGKRTLVERFKALPKRTQAIAGVVALVFLWWFLEEDAPEPTKPKTAVTQKKGATAPTGPSGPVTFESLSPDKQREVEHWHALAFDYFKNREYDKSLFEVEKIFAYLPDYKDSKMLQRYAQEGKRKLEQIEEEKRKKEEEERLKAKVAQLAEEIRDKMTKKQYEQARELFPQLISLDPENIEVAAWRKEIEQFEENRRLQEAEKQVQTEINARAWQVYKEALAIKKQGRFHAAIEAFQKVQDIGASDDKAKKLALKQVQACKNAIRARRDPVLAEALAAEKANDFGNAFKLFRKATVIDPPHPAGYAGIARIKGVLHDRAKVIYTEAVLAESYSDFAVAKAKYQQILTFAPEDDMYYGRAKRKLAHYFREEASQGP